MDESTYKTKLLVRLHCGGFTLYSTEPPERVKEQLGGTCLWVKDIDGADVQLNLREIPMIGVEAMPNE